jgi:hypothetical protein
VQVSPLDCTGCENAPYMPLKRKSADYETLDREIADENDNWNTR